MRSSGTGSGRTWFTSRGSKGHKAIVDLESVVYADGALTQEHRELIATGISIVKNCESCMQWHIEQAAAHDATLEEVIEAIDVAIEMGGGPATVAARFAMDVISEVLDE